MRLLFVLGSGGHTSRGLILSKEGQHEMYYIVPWESEVTKVKVEKNYFSVISPRFRAKDSRVMSVFRTLFLFLHSLIILLVVKPKVLISTGSGLTLPPFLLARFLGMKTRFIESPSRVFNPSIAGKFLLGKVDRWFSSWPELVEQFPGVEYKGMIFEPVKESLSKDELIFVTVGTSLPHDELIQAIDELAGGGEITEDHRIIRGEAKAPAHLRQRKQTHPRSRGNNQTAPSAILPTPTGTAYRELSEKEAKSLLSPQLLQGIETVL